MKDVIMKVLAVLLLVIGGSKTAVAQDDIFNPANPSEPNVLYKIKVSANPAEAAYVSGAGQYRTGKKVQIRTSLATTGYKFLHWTKNGEKYTESQSFTYTVEAGHVDFVAVYQYAPSSPSEPSTINKFRLYLAQQPAESGSFNRDSGEKVETGNWVWVEAYPNQGYEFLGWYSKGKLLNTAQGFNYMMPKEDVTLTAMFKYNPTNPNEPGGTGQSDVANGIVGDLNSDKAVNVTDVVALVNVCINGEEVSVKIADQNGDKAVNITDVVGLVNKCVNGQ